MKDLIDDIITEYQKTGHMNIYIVGKAGSGKTLLTQQILEKICKILNIVPKLEMIDFNNNITSTSGINLIETYDDSSDYKYKIKVLMKQDGNENIKRGFFRYNFGKCNVQKFNNHGIFKEEYYKKKEELMRTHFR